MGPFAPLLEIANRFPSPWKQLLWGAIILGFSGFLIFKTFRYVPQGQRAMLTRNRKVVFRNGKPVYKEAGLHIVFPLVNNLECVSVLDRTYDLRTVTAVYGRFRAINVTATVVFAVEDIYKHRYTAEDPVNRLTSECEALLGGCLYGINPNEIGASLREIEVGFRLVAAPVSEELGVRLKRLNITNVEPRDLITVAGAIASLNPASKEALETLGVSLNGNHSQ